MDGLTVIRRGQLGQVLIEDERDDGSVVVLTCRPWDESGPAGVVLPTSRPGEVPPPDPSAIADKYKGVYPMLRTLEGVHPEKPFVLRIDTSSLPAGPLAFDLDTFIATASTFGGERVDHVTLDASNARDWGLVS